MELEYIAHHIDQDSGLEHLAASMQSKKVLGRLLEVLDEALKDSRNIRSTRRTSSEVLDACRTRLRRARGLVRPGAAGLLTGVECSRIRYSAWICLTAYVTTRTAVGVVGRKGIYPNASE